MQINACLVQFDIIEKDKEANFTKISQLLEKVSADLIVLPEMFQTGFCVGDASVAEGANGPTIQFLSKLSIDNGACVVGSFMCQLGDEIVNRFVAVENGKIIHYYDKIHLFKMGGEHEHITGGQGVSEFDVKGFKIRPLICYDLRFPYVSYNTSSYDALLYVANWPSNRIAHWDALLQARAIENQSYVLASNRVGQQATNFYPGHSSVYMPNGDLLAKSLKEEIISVTLKKEDVQEVRSKLPFLQDQLKL